MLDLGSGGGIDVILSAKRVGPTGTAYGLRHDRRCPEERPAGSDVVAEDELSPAERAQRGSYVGCIAGALSRAEYVEGFRAVVLQDVTVTFTHPAADGMHGAIVQAHKCLSR